MPDALAASTETFVPMAEVTNCRFLSDQDFERLGAVGCPRRIGTKASEAKRGWNSFCPGIRDHQYTPVREPICPMTGSLQEPSSDKDQANSIRATSGRKFLVDSYESTTVPTLPNAGVCLFADGKQPVFGFCQASNSTCKLD